MKYLYILIFITLVICSSLFFNRMLNRSSKAETPQPKKSVVSAKEAASKAYNKCHADGKRITCYARQLEDSAYTYGKSYAFEVLHQIQTMDSTAQACHFFAHGIGWGMAKKDPANWREALRTVTSECAYGEAHGIIEYYINVEGGKITPELARTICSKKSDLGCSHPLGHIFVVEEKGDMNKALELCDNLLENKVTCYHGAFMEHHVQGNLLLHGFADPRRRNWPDFIYEEAKFCRGYKGQGQKEIVCWGRLAHSAYGYFKKDPRKIFNFCNTGPSLEADTQCKLITFAELLPASGLDLMGQKANCTLERSFDPTFEGRCYNEFVKLIFAQSVDIAPKLTPYCLSLPETYRPNCIGTLGSQLKQHKIATKKVETICAPVKSPSLKSLCLGTSNRFSKKN